MVNDANATWAGEAGSVSHAFGMLSLLSCWWFPFGPVLGMIGVFAGAVGWLSGDRSGRSVLGIAFSGAASTVGLIAAWGTWVRLFSI